MLRGLVDIRPEERRNTLAAFATLFLLTTGHTLLETARDVLFLAKIPTTHLPWMYLAIVVLTLALSRVRRARVLSKRAVAGSLLFAAVVTAGFWALVPTKNPQIRALYALYVWTGLFASWATVQFWTLLGRVHTMTQAKRVYGFIGAGAVLGAVVGALSARAAMMLSPRSSILVASIVFAVAAVPCLLVVVPPPSEEEPHAPVLEEGTRRPMRATMSLLWENAFARNVLGLVILATVTVTLADYLFKSRVAAAYPDARQLGVMLSWFYAGTNALALVAQLVVAPFVFQRQGVQRALFVFPALLLGAASAVALTGGKLLATFGLKAVDGSMRYSLHRTSMELLLVPVPDGTRERIKPIVDLLGTRGGQALGSVVILGLVALAATDPATLAAIVGLCATAWIGLVVAIRRHYLDVFRETLRTGGFSGSAEDLPALDLGALETLFEGLGSSRDAEVLASLELLEEQQRERLVPALILYHPSRDVVLRALEIFADRGRTDFVSIADRLNGHPDGEIAAAALRARTKVAPDRRLLEKRAAEPRSQVSVTALVALMARGWIELDEAEVKLQEILASRAWPMAAELARAVRTIAPEDGASSEVGERFDRLLLELDVVAEEIREMAASKGGADDQAAPPDEPVATAVTQLDARVRLEIARAMGVRRSPAFIVPLVSMLRRHDLRATAREALLPIPGALEALAEALADTNTAREVRVHLPRTICLFAPRTAAKILLRQLDVERGGLVRFKVIRGLVKLRRAHPSLELSPEVVTRAVRLTLGHAEQLRRWADAVAAPGGADAGDPDARGAAHHLLAGLLRDKELHAEQRLFLLLELGSDDAFDAIWRGLQSRVPRTRAGSLELLENVLPTELRDRVLSLVDRSRAAAAPPSLSYEDALREMVGHDSNAVQVLAQYRAAELGLTLAAREVKTGGLAAFLRDAVTRAPRSEPSAPQVEISRAPA